jgi:hypothetical protein
MTATKPITITPTMDRKFVVNGFLCRHNRMAALYTVSHAAAKGHLLPVYTKFTPVEFFEIVRAVYPETVRKGNVVAGVLPGVQWEVRIRKLRDV